MFRWYQRSKKCYVFLTDVTTLKRSPAKTAAWEDSFCKTRWFRRGWTLQELIAPHVVEFFTRDGAFLGTKASLEHLIQQATSIATSVLRGAPLSDFSPNERLAWARQRETKKPEDRVYSLLGIFEVSLPIQYGSGLENALRKLEDEIARRWNELDRSTLEPSSEIDPYGIRASNNAVDSDASKNREKRRKQLIESLRFVQMDDREMTIKNPQKDTCEWLFVHPDYLRWNDLSQRRLEESNLWISGKPGVGKSTLMKAIFVHATEAKRDSEIHCHFFFNARGGFLEKSVTGLYRSLLVQIFEQIPHLQYLLDGLPYPPAWSLERTQSLMRKAMHKLGDADITFYIDALDECDEEEIRDMVDFIEELQQEITHTSRFGVCFASRHYLTIRIRNGHRLILENEAGHENDLRLYIEHHLRASSNDAGDEIREQIYQKANGVFIWTVFVINILNREIDRGRMFAVKQRLNEMPPKLSDLFTDMLTRDRVDMDALLICLQLILFAYQPLTPSEFYFAMEAGINLEDKTWAPGPWDRGEVTDEILSRFVPSSSKGLAELTRSESAPTVQFIHESVRDSLLKDGGLSSLWPHAGCPIKSAGHERLKQICARYTNPDMSLMIAHQVLEDLWEDSYYPLLSYSVAHVLRHANTAAEHISQQEFMDHFASLEWLRLQYEQHGQPAPIECTHNPIAFLCATYDYSDLLKLIDKK